MRQFDFLVKRRLLEQERGDYRASIVCAVLANIYRDEKKRRKPFTPLDFMPSGEKPRAKQQTPEQMFRMIKMLNAAYGGKVG